MSELNEGQGTESVESAELSDDAAGSQENTSDSGSDGGNGEPGAEGDGNPENKHEELIEKDGKHYIPKERFDQLNERMKKSEEAAAFLESLRNDPNVRRQWMEEAGLKGQENPSAKVHETPQVMPVEKWVTENVPKESQGHYMGMLGAFAEETSAEMDRRIAQLKEEILKDMAPFKNYVSRTEVDRARKDIPDFQQYESKIVAYMNSHPGVSHLDAYKIVSFDDRFHKGVKTGINKASTQKSNVSKAPVNKNPNSSSAPAGTKAKTFGEAFDRAWNSGQGA